MKNVNRKLVIEQLDRKFDTMSALRNLEPPSRGWIHAIRTAMHMSLAQLAKRLKKTSASVSEIENRERSKNITLKKLAEVGEALDLQLVYGFIPKTSSLEAIIEQRAKQIARDIVMRTSQSMKLEEQENSEARLQKAINDRARQIQMEMPKYLWD